MPKNEFFSIGLIGLSYTSVCHALQNMVLQAKIHADLTKEWPWKCMPHGV